MPTPYVRKTTTVRREPGGLECALLHLLVDGYKTNVDMARILETSTENVNNGLTRLSMNGLAYRDAERVPFQWWATAKGRSTLEDELKWL